MKTKIIDLILLLSGPVISVLGYFGVDIHPELPGALSVLWEAFFRVLQLVGLITLARYSAPAGYRLHLRKKAKKLGKN